MPERHVAPGVILQLHPVGDHDAVVSVLTGTHGRLACFASGARRSRPRFGAALAPLGLCELEWREGRPGALPRLDRADLLEGHLGLRRDLERLTLASAAAEAASLVCPEGEPAPEIHGLLLEFLGRLATDGSPWPLWAGFQLQLLAGAGYDPELGACLRCRALVPPGRAVVLFPSEGGLLCAACRGPREDGLRVSALAAAALRAVSGAPLAVAATQRFPPALERELRVVLPALLEPTLGRPLRSLELLLV